MTVGEFLDAAYAVQVREATRLGIPLLDALERMQPQAAHSTERRPQTPSPPSAAAANTRALAQLEIAMGGAKRRA